MSAARIYVTRVKAKDALDAQNSKYIGWQAAIDKEFNAFKSRDVYEKMSRADLKPDDRPVPMVNLYEEKSDGRLKVRSIVLGDRVTRDPAESDYSPVVDMATLRLLLALATQEDLHICGCDVSEAFLNALLAEGERIIVKPPREFVERGGGEYWLLKRAVYGLPQSPLRWNRHQHDELVVLGWRRSNIDACYYTKVVDGKKIHLVAYVDDYLLFGDKVVVEKERTDLLARFPSGGRLLDPDEQGRIKFLGMDIERSKGRIRVTQTELIDQVIDRFGQRDAADARTPILQPLQEHGEKILPGEFGYRQLVGSLMYLMVNTRPDIAFAVKELSRFLESPTQEHVTAGKRVLRYLKATRNHCLEYKKSKSYDPENISSLFEFYTDSDFANEVPGRKSTTGNLITVAGTPIHWKSVTQRIVALSTAEAEYIALAQLVKDLKYYHKLIQEIWGKQKEKTNDFDLDELGLTGDEEGFESLNGRYSLNMEGKEPYSVNCDNQAAIHMSKSDILTARTKHIDIRASFIASAIKDKLINVKYINTLENL